MTEAEKKANELVEDFREYSQGHYNTEMELHNAKKCALICVNEMIREANRWEGYMAMIRVEELKKVKQAIEIINK